MTKKNIFVYELFLSLNISDFRFQIPLPPLFENWLPGSTLAPPTAERGRGGAHYVSANGGVHLDQVFS